MALEPLEGAMLLRTSRAVPAQRRGVPWT
jgi:hypothetical protein